jgi:hypothetical protein
VQGVKGLDVEGLGVSVEWVSSRHRGLSRAMALHVAKSAFQSFLERAGKIHPLDSIDRGCAAQPVNSCRGARLMGMREKWSAQRKDSVRGSSCRDPRFSAGDNGFRK